MKKEYVKKRLICAVLAAALCIAPMLFHSAYAQETDQETPARPGVAPGATASLTLGLGNTEGFEQDLAGKEISVNVYRVADITEEAGFAAVDAFKDAADWSELGNTTEAWLAMAKKLAAYVDENETTPDGTAAVSIGGSQTVEGIVGTGLYLVYPETVVSDDYTYTFQPYLVSLPSWDDMTNIWAYNVTSTFKVGREERMGEIIIRKNLDSYNENLGGAIFVFEVTAYKDRDGDGTEEIVFSDMITLNFENPGTRSATVKDIPLGSRVEISEVYSGSAYELSGDGEGGYVVNLSTENESETVTFDNTYNNGRNGGSGVVNHFEHTESADPAIRSWKEPVQQQDNADNQGE